MSKKKQGHPVFASKGRTFEVIETDRLKPAPWNPPMRTTDPALHVLASTIAAAGGVLVPLVIARVAGVNLVVDGHRRLAVAKQQGIGSLRCVVLECTEAEAQAWWVLLNKGAKSIDAKQWMSFDYDTHGKQREYMPKGTLRDIKECERVFGGREGIRYLLDHNTAPTVVSMILQLVVRYSQCRELTQPSEQRIGRWIVETKSQSTVGSALGMGLRLPASILRKIHARILASKKLEQVDLMPRQRSGKAA